MVQELNLEQVEDRFREVARRVNASHEAVVVEDDGERLVAIVPVSDLTLLGKVQAGEKDLYAKAAAAFDAVFYAPSREEQEIVDAVKQDRAARYRERHGRSSA